jgi:hypothetical protein
LKCSSSHAVANRPITRSCRRGPTALLAKCATTRALCSDAIAPVRGSAHHQLDRRKRAVAPVRVGRLCHGQTLVDRRAEVGVADARVRVRVVNCRERRKERAETRLRLQAVKLGAVRASSCRMSGMPARSVSVCSA